MRFIPFLMAGLSGLFLLTASAPAEHQGGLIFRAYDYNQDQRTSLVIPDSEGCALRLKKYLSLGFDLKVRPNLERFGYVCRIVIGGQTCVDLLLNNPANEESHFCLIRDKKFLSKLHPGGPPLDLNAWNRIHLELLATDGKLTIRENGVTVSSGSALPHDNRVRICFGMNDQPGYTTTDVAPVILRNLVIGTSPDGAPYEWPLERAEKGPALTDESGRLNARIANPQWQIDRHTHWTLIRTQRFSSRVFPVPGPAGDTFYFITRDCVYRLRLSGNLLTEYPFSPALPIDYLSGQFLYHPGYGQLVCYDFEQSDEHVLSRFDPDKGAWFPPLERHKEPSNLHHSGFVSPTDSSVIQLFGYGFHTYRRSMERIAPSGKITRTELPASLPCRYLSAVGANGRLLYIYGGVGNDSGLQEYGIHTLNDLYTLNLDDYSLTKKWSRESTAGDEAAASSLIIDPDGKHAMGLFFNPYRFFSYLTLKRMDLETGETVPLADSIPYTFHDTDSDADLIYSESQGCFYAVTIHKTEGGSYEANIYSVAAPVLPVLPSRENRSAPLWPVPAGVAALCLLAWGVAVLMRRRQKAAPVHPASPDEGEVASLFDKELLPAENKRPGIYLLNGFQVIDRNGEDITGEFTPIMRQLLSLIILSTYSNGKGISNVRLRECLWTDKSEKSSRNNRSVHIRKIRLLLGQVGGCGITSANSYWSFVPDGNTYCDYLDAMETIQQTGKASRTDEVNLTAILQVASRGHLLPNMQLEWLDGFKADYSDSVINLLSRLRDNTQVAGDPRVQILLSDGILRFDSLDETSVRVKCRALAELKRLGMAHSIFDAFTREYQQVIGEKFPDSFEKFIH